MAKAWTRPEKLSIVVFLEFRNLVSEYYGSFRIQLWSFRKVSFQSKTSTQAMGSDGKDADSKGSDGKGSESKGSDGKGKHDDDGKGKSKDESESKGKGLNYLPPGMLRKAKTENQAMGSDGKGSGKGDSKDSDGKGQQVIPKFNAEAYEVKSDSSKGDGKSSSSRMVPPPMRGSVAAATLAASSSAATPPQPKLMPTSGLVCCNCLADSSIDSRLSWYFIGRLFDHQCQVNSCSATSGCRLLAGRLRHQA